MNSDDEAVDFLVRVKKDTMLLAKEEGLEHAATALLERAATVLPQLGSRHKEKRLLHLKFCFVDLLMPQLLPAAAKALGIAEAPAERQTINADLAACVGQKGKWEAETTAPEWAKFVLKLQRLLPSVDGRMMQDLVVHAHGCHGKATGGTKPAKVYDLKLWRLDGLPMEFCRQAFQLTWVGIGGSPGSESAMKDWLATYSGAHVKGCAMLAVLASKPDEVLGVITWRRSSKHWKGGTALQVDELAGRTGEACGAPAALLGKVKDEARSLGAKTLVVLKSVMKRSSKQPDGKVWVKPTRGIGDYAVAVFRVRQYLKSKSASLAYEIADAPHHRCLIVTLEYRAETTTGVVLHDKVCAEAVNFTQLGCVKFTETTNDRRGKAVKFYKAQRFVELDVALCTDLDYPRIQNAPDFWSTATFVPGFTSDQTCEKDYRSKVWSEELEAQERR